MKSQIPLDQPGEVEFDDDNNPEARRKRKYEREREVKDRANRLIYIWDTEKVSEKFEKETDPLVI